MSQQVAEERESFLNPLAERGAKVVLCYAPGVDVPLDALYEIDSSRRISQKPREAFAHSALCDRWPIPPATCTGAGWDWRAPQTQKETS